MTNATTSSGLRSRLISSAIGIPVVLVAILADVPGVAVLTVVAGLIAGDEISRMARCKSRTRILFAGFVALLVLTGVTVATADSTPLTLATLSMAAALILLARFFVTSPSAHNDNGQQSASLNLYVFAALYFGIALAHAAPLVSEADGRNWILLAILGTFAVDTGAYFTGRAIGRHKLAPAISPKKTWEGVFGGGVAAIGAVIALAALMNLPLAAWQSALLAIALTGVGVTGDLFESWLKRKANVKDSGNIIPGHGGILDRIDSLAPNIAVVYWAVQLLEI